MKQLLYLSLSVFLFLGCTKKNQEVKQNNGLIGKWKLSETYISAGAGGSWQPFNSAVPVTIDFTADSAFNYSPNFEKAYLQLNRYSLSGDILSMSSTNNNNKDTWAIGPISNTRIEMSINRCVEPCMIRFVPF